VKSRLLLSSVALHAGLIGGAVAWAAGSAAREDLRPARIAFRPSEPAVAWTESLPPEPQLAEPEDLAEPSPEAWVQPAPVPFEPPEAPPPQPVEPLDPLEQGAFAIPADALAMLRREPVDEAEPAEAVGTAIPREPIVEPPARETPPTPTFVEARALEDRNEKPPYPAEAIRRSQEGTVWLRLSIDADGRVLDVAIATPCPHPVLNRAAVRAARDWVFEPARQDGRPIASEKDVPVEFRLVDGTERR
jgi:protein TonB